MNVQLYNRLSETLDFFKKMESYDKQLKDCERHGATYDLEIMALETNKRSVRKYKLSIPLAIFLTIFFPLIGILYIVIVLNSTQEETVWDPANIPSERKQRYEEVMKLARQARSEAGARSNKINAEKTNYYNNNCQRCLGYLPQPVRTKGNVEALIYNVRRGRINNIDDIREWYAENLREIAELEHKADLQEAQRKQHTETVAALKEISDNQEKINNELETMRQIRRNKW